jgi:hypothetical protein
MTELREQVVFGRSIDWEEESVGGVVRFKDLKTEDAKRLMKAGEIDPEGRQNNSPMASEFIKFMDSVDDHDIRAIGYMVAPDRSDSRITIEGLRVDESISRDLMLRFTNKFRMADEFTVEEDYLRCWYD